MKKRSIWECLRRLFREKNHVQALDKYRELCEYARQLSGDVTMYEKTYTFLLEEVTEADASIKHQDYPPDYLIVIREVAKKITKNGLRGWEFYRQVQLKRHYYRCRSKIIKSKEFFLRQELSST